MTVAELAVDLLATAATGLGDARPDRRIVTIGPVTDPLNEADQLGVGWIRSFRGVPGREDTSPDAQCWTPNVAEFVVRLVRCSPTSTNVDDTDPAAMTEAASDLMDEGAALHAALMAWNPDTRESPRDLYVGPLNAVRSTGLVFAVQVTVHVVT